MTHVLMIENSKILLSKHNSAINQQDNHIGQNYSKRGPKEAQQQQKTSEVDLKLSLYSNSLRAQLQPRMS